MSFVDLGIAHGLFNVASALCQTPMGYAVDRYGARSDLIAGPVLGSASFALLALSPTYGVLLVAMTLTGRANGVYRPADYALLSQRMDPERMGRSLSIHTSAGFLGGAVAPSIMVGHRSGRLRRAPGQGTARRGPQGLRYIHDPRDATTHIIMQ